MSASEPKIYCEPIQLTGDMYSIEETPGQDRRVLALDLKCDLLVSIFGRVDRMVIQLPEKGKEGKVTFYGGTAPSSEIKVGANGVKTWASLLPDGFGFDLSKVQSSVPSEPGTTTLEGEKVEEPAHESDQTGHERAPDRPTPVGHGVQRE